MCNKRTYCLKTLLETTIFFLRSFTLTTFIGSDLPIKASKSRIGLTSICEPGKNASIPIENTTSDKTTGKEFETYRVRTNDTLYGIARQYDISIKELMDINNKDDFTIKEGEVIKIRRIQ